MEAREQNRERRPGIQLWNSPVFPTLNRHFSPEEPAPRSSAALPSLSLCRETRILKTPTEPSGTGLRCHLILETNTATPPLSVHVRNTGMCKYNCKRAYKADWPLLPKTKVIETNTEERFITGNFNTVPTTQQETEKWQMEK